jgi:galactokinase
MRSASSNFLAAMEELATTLGVTSEWLARYDTTTIRELAFVVLRRDARYIVVCQTEAQRQESGMEYEQRLKGCAEAYERMKKHYKYFVSHNIFSGERLEADKVYAAVFAAIHE